MKLMRDMLKDRLATGLIAGLLAYFLLMQGFAAAFAQGAMASSGVAGFVICTTDGAGLDTSGSSTPVRSAHDCCTALCQTGCAVSPALPGDHAGLDCTSSDAFSGARLPDTLVFHPVAFGFLAEARAPPSFSI